jgi:hypothetical protein
LLGPVRRDPSRKFSDGALGDHSENDGAADVELTKHYE